MNEPSRTLDAVLAQLVLRMRGRLPDLKGIWLFGSRATGRALPQSDIDLAVLGAGPFDPVQLFDLGLELGVDAGRDVDLVDLRRASTVLRKEVVTGGRLIATDDAATCEAFVADSMALYVAFKDELLLAGAGPGPR